MEISIARWKTNDVLALCRTCMGKVGLNPIFNNEDDNKYYSDALLTIADVKVDINDGLPQNICTECIEILNKALKFRKTCREVETKLKEIAGEVIHLSTVKIKVEDCDSSNSTEEFTNEDDVIKKENIEIRLNKGNKDNCSNLLVCAHPAVLRKQSLEEKDDFTRDNSQLLEDNISINTPSNAPDSEHVNWRMDEDSLLENEHKQKSQKKSKRRVKKKLKVIQEKEQIATTDDITDVGGNKPRVKCKVCLKDLSVRSIEVHMTRLHPGADETRVKCELCDRFVRSCRLRRHVASVHGDGTFFRCGHCKAEFASRELLVEHLTSCTEKNKKRKPCESGRQMVECDVCHKMMQKASVRMHKAIKHAGLGPVCEHCGKKFGNKFRLNEHYRAKHGYEKFKCSYCDFQSSGITSMRNHERRHRGEKPFVCEECGAKFHASRLLHQHKLSHRTDKPVQCDRCPARFKSKYSLRAHRISRHKIPSKIQSLTDDSEIQLCETQSDTAL